MRHWTYPLYSDRETHFPVSRQILAFGRRASPIPSAPGVASGLENMPPLPVDTISLPVHDGDVLARGSASNPWADIHPGGGGVAVSPLAVTGTRLEQIDAEIQLLAAGIVANLRQRLKAAKAKAGTEAGAGGARSGVPLPVSHPSLLAGEMRLGELREERERIAEGKRVAETAAEFQEMHPSQLEECSACRASVIGANGGVMFLPCCRQTVCLRCIGAEGETCAMCHAGRSGADEEERIRRMLDWKGGDDDKHAQLLLFDATAGDPTLKDRRVQWLRSSAEQGCGRALFLLGMAHCGEDAAIPFSVTGIDVDPAKSRSFLHRAAHLGDIDAQYYLGQAFLAEGDVPSAKRMLTVAAVADDSGSSLLAQHALGLHYLHNEQGQASELRAWYWLERAAVRGHARAGLAAARTLANLTVRRYALHGCLCYAGDGSLARSVIMAREAIEACVNEGRLGELSAHEAVTLCDLEDRVGKFCATCYRTDTRLLGCGRCKAAYYCSKQCQLSHRKLGHKQVCKVCK